MFKNHLKQTDMTAFNELLLKTAFCCMASDGEIAQEEIDTIQQLCKKEDFFKGFDFTNEIKKFVAAINIQGKKFITEYLNELEKTTLAEDEQLTLLKIAFVVIYADEKVEYSEVKFFKNIRSRLSVIDETIKQRFEDIPDLDIFLAQDLINNFSLEKITEEYFNSVSLPQFNIGDFKV